MDSRLLAIRALALNAVAVTVITAFEAAGVDYLLLKGPAMARWLYPDGRLRPFRDVDLLVAPGQLRLAEDCLVALSCRPSKDPSPHATTWTAPPGAAGTVDLHHSFHYVTVSDQRCWDVLSTSSGSIELGGRSVRVPSPAPLGALLVLQVALADASAQCQADLTWALGHEADEFWADAAAVAAQLGATEAFAEGLRRASGAQRLLERLELPPLRSAEIALTLEDQPRTTAGVGRLLGARSPAALFRRLGAELLPSPAHMRSCYPRLARWKPGGLFVSYLVRPAFVVVQAPGGLRAWRQIQRKVRPAAGPKRSQRPD